MINTGDYYTKPLEAFVKGSRISVPDMDRLYETGKEAGLKVHYFKRSGLLPRVRIVLGFLNGIVFDSLLDVGSGRGAFLWPLLDAFPEREIHVIDMLEHRSAMHRAVAKGGAYNMHVYNGDIRTLNLPDKSVDVVTMLEVLEHIPDAAGAVRNAARLARKHIVVTVPSKPDDNPEHIHLFTPNALKEMFVSAGWSKVNFGSVPGHIFMVASC